MSNLAPAGQVGKIENLVSEPQVAETMRDPQVPAGMVQVTMEAFFSDPRFQVLSPNDLMPQDVDVKSRWHRSDWRMSRDLVGVSFSDSSCEHEPRYFMTPRRPA